MSIVEKYTYSVQWSEEDQLYLGRVAEFPSLLAHGSTQKRALAELRNAVTLVIEDLRSAGDHPLPEPLGKRRFSGRILVRTSPELHRSLVTAAATQGVSLNHLITTRLAGSVR